MTPDRRTKPRREDDERVLPHSLEAEKSVLGAILLHADAYDRAARLLDSRHFYRDAHRRIWAAMRKLLERPGGVMDMPLLREALGKDLAEIGGPVYLSSLVDGVPRSTNVAHYAAIVRDKWLLRQCVNVGNRLASDGYIGEDAPATILAEADQALVQLQHGTSAGQMQSLKQSSSAFLDNIEWRVSHKGELTGVDTGFQNINEYNLGWQRGDMNIVAARPSIGKTSFVMNSGMLSAESKRDDGTQCHVAVFSLEMKRQQLEIRLLSSLSNVDAAKVQGGWINDRDWAPVTQAIGRMAEANLHIDDRAALTVGDVRAECRRLKSEHGLDLVIIDYVQLMTGSLDRRGANRTEELAHISRSLKVMFGELGVSGLVLSQLKRPSDHRRDPRPKLEDLRESGALEQDADAVLFLHRANHREGGRTELIFEKQRNGPTGTLYLEFTKETCLFTVGTEPTVAEVHAENAQEDAEAKKHAIIRNRSKKRTDK